QQSGNALVALLGEIAVIDFDVVVVVPRLAGPVPELDHPHATFDESTGDEALPCVNAGAVHVLNVFWFERHVEGIGRLALHAEGDLETFDAGIESRFSLAV